MIKKKQKSRIFNQNQQSFYFQDFYSSSESHKSKLNIIEDRIESEGKVFLERVAAGFTTIARQEDWIVVPANKSKEIVSREIELSIINSVGKQK